ncbi:MAG: nitronate monooxygenase, partial [Halieaceae bacterium]|nr:nitronate monooxygenase [Halieaceae bacterium]
MKTRLTALYGIQPPIIQGALHHAGYAQLAAAVSTAGAHGTITRLTQHPP